MSFTDFDFNYERYGVDILSQPNGDAVLNSSLTNPLTGTGSYCRRFRLDDTVTTGQAEIKATCNSGPLSGTLVNPAYDTAVTLRAWVRLDTGTFGTSSEPGAVRRVWTGLTAFTTIPSTNSLFGGWELALQASRTSGGAVDTSLVLRGGPPTYLTNSASAPVNDLSYNLLATAEAGLSRETWYLVRLDVVPNSASQKTITAYRSTDGGTSWNTLATHVSTSGDPDWPSSSDDKICGFTFGTTNAYNYSRTMQANAYIDKFQAGTETIP